MTMTSLLWRHLYLERRQSVQYFGQQFSFATCTCWTALRVKREKWTSPTRNMFKRQTLTFYFSTYCPNSCKHLSHNTPVWPHDGIDRCDRCTGCPNNTATISATFSRPWANFLHQTCIAGLVQYLSPYSGRISDWMAFAPSPFAHSKRITEGCSLWDDFNGNVAQWRHHNKCHCSYSELNLLQNVYFKLFIVWKLR